MHETQVINPSTTTHSNAEPDRRLALKKMAGLLGLSLSANAINLLAATPDKKLNLLSEPQLKLTGVLADLIIPTTDTPGALAADVHYFIDQYLAECKSKTEQTSFVAGLNRIDEVVRKEFEKSFTELKPTQQVTTLKNLSTGQAGFTRVDQAFFHQLKTLVLFGYYTSEIGAAQELAYLPIPGGYHGNFPFSKVGKAWSINN